MKHFFFIICLSFISAFACAQRGIETETIEVNGLLREYRVYLPVSYNSETSYPLVFILHGGAGSAKRMIRFVGQSFNQLADMEEFIAVYPNGYKKGWNDGARDTLAAARRLNIDDVAFFDAMILDLKKKVTVDTKHIFACGISNGGFMVQRLALERPDVFRSVAVVSANLSEDQSRKSQGSKPVPILFICGTADPLVPYYGGPVTVLNQKRGMVKSMDETLDFWKKVNGCSEEASRYDFPDVNIDDESTATQTTWYNPDHSAWMVSVIKIENGGHTWPGGTQYLPKKLVGTVNRDFEACKVIWAFFKKQM